jgi:hypothetical protein
MHGLVTVTVDCGVSLRSRPSFGHVSNMNHWGKCYYPFVAGVIRIEGLIEPRRFPHRRHAACRVSRVACDRRDVISSEASEA